MKQDEEAEELENVDKCDICIELRKYQRPNYSSGLPSLRGVTPLSRA